MAMWTRAWWRRVGAVGLVVVVVAPLSGGDAVGAPRSDPFRAGPETAPAPNDPDGTDARVVLGCAGDPARRVVAGFDAPTEPGQEAMLYATTPLGVETVTIGSEVPATPELFWAIAGVMLGPWPVGTVNDTCVSGPPDGSGTLVRLRCGSTAAWREVLSFTAPVDAGQEAILYLAQPQSGGEALTVVGERDEIPAFSELRWSIRDVELGPWPVVVDDPCGVNDTPLPPGSNGGAVVLDCGTRATTRVISSFEAPVADGEEALLSLVSGGGLGTSAQVGDEVPESAGFAWSIAGVQLGPWNVQTLTDVCSSGGGPEPAVGELPVTGRPPPMVLVFVGSTLIGTGLVFGRLGSSDRAPGRSKTR